MINLNNLKVGEKAVVGVVPESLIPYAHSAQDIFESVGQQSLELSKLAKKLKSKDLEKISKDILKIVDGPLRNQISFLLNPSH